MTPDSHPLPARHARVRPAPGRISQQPWPVRTFGPFARRTRAFAGPTRAALLPAGSLAVGRLAQLDLAADIEPRAGVERAARAGADGADPGAGPADLHACPGVVVDHQLGPQRAVVGAVPRGLGRRAQRLEARLLLAAGGAAEAG